MNRLLTFVVLLLGAGVSTAMAEPYWVTYEANDLPENEGWERLYGNWEGPGQGGGYRTIQDGILTIDTMHDDGAVEGAMMVRPGNMNPDVGELFIATWRLRIVETRNNWYEPSVAIARDAKGTLAFRYSMDSILSSREGWSMDIAPGAYHTYHLESTDMINYHLWIDDVHVRDGVWDLDSLNESYLFFWDGTQGPDSGSVAQWDYVRFGVIPEPSCLLLGTAVLVGISARREIKRGSRS
jgi:hypothetical protein